MVYLLIKQTVRDCPAWKNAFDEFLEYRRICGELSCEFYQSETRNDELIVLSKWDNIENMEDFLKSQSFRMIRELEEKEPVVVTVPLVLEQVFG